MGHGLVALAAAIGVVAQFVEMWTGALETPEDPLDPLPYRIWRFFSYFTIQSNLIVLVTTLILALNPDRDGLGWRMVRLNGVVGITVTGIVHWILLRPLQALTGWAWFWDRMVHVIVPLLAVAGWLLLGPRPRIAFRVVLLALIWPIVWMVYTMIVGAATGWYPYAFLDVGERGAGPVAVTSVVITLLVFAVCCLFWLGDRKLPTLGAGNRQRVRVRLERG